MFRPIIIEFRNTARHWTARPFWAASLVALLTMLIISGPLACIAHCAVFGLEHMAHGHAHHQHEVPASTTADASRLISDEYGNHALCDYMMGQSPDLAPNPLTIAVLLAIVFFPQIRVVAVRSVDRKPLLRLLALPPPPDPPRYAPGLA